jgi:hypothetical protein
MKGVRSGYVSVDAMRSLTITLCILYDPYVDLWLRVRGSARWQEKLATCGPDSLNTLTSMQYLYNIFGPMSVDRLTGTVKGPFKTIRYYLGG